MVCLDSFHQNCIYAAGICVPVMPAFVGMSLVQASMWVCVGLCACAQRGGIDPYQVWDARCMWSNTALGGKNA